LKCIGWLITFVGALITFTNFMTYNSKSSEIQAWYYYRTELESARTFLIVGLVIVIIGIAILMATYLKNNND